MPAADFCNFKCAFYNASSDLPTDSGKPQNITLYRITPFNVSGIVNKNTGDAPGDVRFFLERKNITQECAKDPHSFGCFLDGDNMYGKFTVEVDGLWGPYHQSGYCAPVTYLYNGTVAAGPPPRFSPRTTAAGSPWWSNAPPAMRPSTSSVRGTVAFAPARKPHWSTPSTPNERQCSNNWNG